MNIGYFFNVAFIKNLVFNFFLNYVVVSLYLIIEKTLLESKGSMELLTEIYLQIFNYLGFFFPILY